MIKRFIYRVAGSGDEGGFSLSDVDATEEEGSDVGSLKNLNETDEERDAREAEEATVLAEKLEQEQADKLAAEKETEKKPKEEEKPAEENLEEDEEANNFLAQIDELRGDSVEVDYGDVDPLSPEGVVVRERALEDAAVNEYDEYLKNKYPKAYAYFLHNSEGKADEDFFGSTSDLDNLPTEEELEASVEVQKQIILRNLVAKGNSEKHVGIIIKQAIEDNELEEMSKEALKERAAARDGKLQEVESENLKAVEQRQTNIKNMETYVDQVVATGQIGNIVIPEKERAEFAGQFKKSLRLEGDKFVVVTEITKDNVADLFGKEYFSYKKGNLDHIVTTKAKSANAQRLRQNSLRVDKTQKTKESGGVRGTTLSDI